MRRARGSSLVVTGALLALAAALSPGSAAAASPATSIGIHLERGRYDVSVGNLGQTVFLSVETGAMSSQRRVAATSYVVHGTATESRLEADFGKLGEISMRFHPSRNRTWVKPNRDCRGLGQFLVRRGTWQGRLRFRGEDDYLGLDLHRVRGTVETIAPQCRRQGSKRHSGKRHGGKRGSGKRRSGKHGDEHRPRKHRAGRRHRGSHPGLSDRERVAPTQEPELGPEAPVLLAHWRQGVAAAEFIGGSAKEGSVFYAATQETRGGVAVFRSARAEAKPKAVRANDALTRAKLTPPWPFHRSASYRAAPDGSKTWSGYLFVSFPGAQHYPLTGEPFRSRLEFFPELLVGLIGLFSD
ncbi:MAG: hypothetical protein AB7V58_04470 [Solirubrobacterales bacterium]